MMISTLNESKSVHKMLYKFTKTNGDAQGFYNKSMFYTIKLFFNEQEMIKDFGYNPDCFEMLMNIYKNEDYIYYSFTEYSDNGKVHDLLKGPKDSFIENLINHLCRAFVPQKIFIKLIEKYQL